MNRRSAVVKVFNKVKNKTRPKNLRHKEQDYSNAKKGPTNFFFSTLKDAFIAKPCRYVRKIVLA